MLVRTLLLFALGGFVLGSVGGWEAAKVNTGIAAEKWRNYRAGTQVIVWPVEYDRAKSIRQPGCSVQSGFWNPALEEVVRHAERQLATCAGVLSVRSVGAWIIITVEAGQFDDAELLRALPPMRETTTEEYQDLIRSLREPQAPRLGC